MKVRNMMSSRGNEVANQFIISDCRIKLPHKDTELSIKGNMFQSYDSNIAFIPCFECKGTVKVFLDKRTWAYSVTTGKYRNQFLGEGIADTRKKIESGEYKLVDLN